MARIFQTGFENNTVTAGHEWDTTTGSPTISTSIVRSGKYSLRANPTAATAYIGTQYSADGTDIIYYMRFYMLIATSTDALDSILQIRNLGSASGNLVSLRLNSNRTLELWDDVAGVQEGSDSSALNTNEWNKLEVKIDNSLALSEYVCTFYLNDVSIGTVAWNKSFNEGDSFRLGAVTATTCDLYFDDIAVNNSLGSYQNSFPGEGRIVHLRPNAAGDNSAWTNTYTNVDDITPNDATDYIESNTNNQIEDMHIESPSLYMFPDDLINAAFVVPRFAVSSTTGADPSFKVRLTIQGTTDSGPATAIVATSASWFTNAIAIPRTMIELSNSSNYEKPGTAQQMYAGDLEEAQIGVIETLTDTHFARITQLYLSVDYRHMPKPFRAKPRKPQINWQI